MIKKLHEEYEEVMHYTTASGLYGIVTSKTLWASHTCFLNDTEEVVGFFNRVLPEILKTEVERYFKDAESLQILQQPALSSGDIAHYYLKKIVDKCREGEERAQDHYVISFCTTDEAWVSKHGLLSQWRGYGLDGGYAIVFDSAGLNTILTEESRLYHEESLMFATAQYHMSELARITDRQVLDLIRNLQESVSIYLKTRDASKYDFDSATRLATTCKHRGF